MNIKFSIKCNFFIIKKLLYFPGIVILIFYSCLAETNSNQKAKNIDSSYNQNANLINDTIISTYSIQNKAVEHFEYRPELDFLTEDEYRFINTATFNLTISPKGNYTEIKNNIKQKKNEFYNQFLNAGNRINESQQVINEAREYLTEILLNEIFPFWYGMAWSFSGYSEIPNTGEVGCSYFVSNTLKHGGFILNRYKLAQQNSSNIPLSIQLSDSILIFNSNDYIQPMKNYFKKYKKEGLYIVGLDCHIGYLLYRNEELIFIHSNYATPQVVVAEFADKSDVFGSNNYFIADLTWNDKLIVKWMNSEEIQVRN
jgi:hypothetical protein